MNFYEKELNAIKKSNRFRQRKIYDKDLIDCASNDYLGLGTNKELYKKAYERVLKEKNISPKASMLVNGYSLIHQEFEENLCRANNFENGIVVGSGFLANISMIEALVRKKDILFIDEEYHASGQLASKLVEENTIVFKHNDFNDLEEKIKSLKNYNRLIIAIEGVYSMGGDIAPREFNDIALKYNAILIVDEAHSSGVIGQNLLGWFDYWNIQTKPNHIKMGTLGKAYGSYGAYILSSSHIIRYLENRAKAIIYTTAPSLFDIALANESLKYIINYKKILFNKINEYQKIIFDELNIKVDSMIVPIVIDDNKKVLEIQEMLLQKGYIVGAIRQPTVQKAIIRFILKLDIEKKDIKNACKIIKTMIE
jgi:8-amino-7-oxononanoate synthase